MRRLKIVIADDHRLMLAALRLAIEPASDMEVVAEADSGSQVLPLVHQHSPDVVLLDIRMPGMDGLRCLEQLKARFPHVNAIALSGVDDPQVIQAALERGASAFILKYIDPGDLPSAIRQTVEGTVFRTLGSSGAPAAEVSGKDLGLSERELTILKALSAGLSNKQIAQQLWLAEQTVKFHLTNIYRKLEVGSRTEAIRAAYEHGLVENPLLSGASAA
jgi:two-component system, NarL family, response regulator